MKKIITLCLIALFSISLNSCTPKSPKSAITALLKEASEQVEKAQSMAEIDSINQKITVKFMELQEEYKDYIMTEDEIKELNPVYEQCNIVYETKITEITLKDNETQSDQSQE